ncbi:MAG: CDP-glycerol glycerophosphotransferase family protein [Aeromicrobium sp.]
MRLTYRIAILLPLRDRVVLATSHKDAIDGNLAVIHAELWLRLVPDAVRRLAYRSSPTTLGLIRTVLAEITGAFLLATSRVFIVDGYFFPIYPVQLRTGTFVIQTWHACGAFKKFGLSLGEHSFGGGAELTDRVAIHSNYAVCLASSRGTAEAYAEAFGQPLERFDWQTGIPRTDGLIRPDVARVATLRSELGLTDGRRVILYAPTFRGEQGTSARNPSELDLELLARELSAEFVLLLRSHPFVRERTALGRYAQDFVIDVSDHADINELMLASDILVTDYSSVIFDFALLGRPIVFFAPDHAAYERGRGFYFDYRHDGPGPVFDTTQTLADFLRAGSFDLDRVARFARRWFTVADGHATERFVERWVMPRLGSAALRVLPRDSD